MEIILKIGATEEEIRSETTKLAQQIMTRKAEIDQLRLAITMYQKQCKHPGQKTGYNDRDGSWANACPVCGDSK